MWEVINSIFVPVSGQGVSSSIILWIVHSIKYILLFTELSMMEMNIRSLWNALMPASKAMTKILNVCVTFIIKDSLTLSENYCKFELKPKN